MSPTSGVIGEALRLYREHWHHLIGLAAVVYVAVALLSLVTGLVFGTAGAVLAGVIGFLATFWTEAALVEAVQDIRDGRADLSIGETFRRVGPRLGAVIGASILAGLGIALGFVLLIVPGLILLTLWSLLVPVIVLEGTPAMQSFGRSRELVRGYGMSVFGVIVLAFLVLLAVTIVVAIVFAPIGNSGVRQALSNLVSGVLTAPVYALVATVLYFRLRAAHGDDTSPAVIAAEPG
jgi:hypothetical protein